MPIFVGCPSATRCLQELTLQLSRFPEAVDKTGPWTVEHRFRFSIKSARKYLLKPRNKWPEHSGVNSQKDSANWPAATSLLSDTLAGTSAIRSSVAEIVMFHCHDFAQKEKLSTSRLVSLDYGCIGAWVLLHTPAEWTWKFQPREDASMLCGNKLVFQVLHCHPMQLQIQKYARKVHLWIIN